MNCMIPLRKSTVPSSFWVSSINEAFLAHVNPHRCNNNLNIHGSCLESTKQKQDFLNKISQIRSYQCNYSFIFLLRWNVIRPRYFLFSLSRYLLNYHQILRAMTATFLGESSGSNRGHMIASTEPSCSWRNNNLSSRIKVSTTGPKAERRDQ